MDVTPAKPPSVPPGSPAPAPLPVADVAALARTPVTYGVVILMLGTVAFTAGGLIWSRIGTVETNLTGEIRTVDTRLESRINTLDQKFDRLQDGLSKTREDLAGVRVKLDLIDARFDRIEALLTQSKGR